MVKMLSSHSGWKLLVHLSISELQDHMYNSVKTCKTILSGICLWLLFLPLCMLDDCSLCYLCVSYHSELKEKEAFALYVMQSLYAKLLVLPPLLADEFGCLPRSAPARLIKNPPVSLDLPQLRVSRFRSSSQNLRQPMLPTWQMVHFVRLIPSAGYLRCKDEWGLAIFHNRK